VGRGDGRLMGIVCIGRKRGLKREEGIRRANGRGRQKVKK